MKTSLMNPQGADLLRVRMDPNDHFYTPVGQLLLILASTQAFNGSIKISDLLKKIDASE